MKGVCHVELKGKEIVSTEVSSNLVCSQVGMKHGYKLATRYDDQFHTNTNISDSISKNA